MNQNITQKLSYLGNRIREWTVICMYVQYIPYRHSPLHFSKYSVNKNNNIDNKMCWLFSQQLEGARLCLPSIVSCAMRAGGQ